MLSEKPPEQNKQRPEFKEDKDGYVNFGDVSREFISTCQQGIKYTGGWEWDGYPNLGEGLRIKGNREDYHSVKIHKDDIDEFIRRYEAMIFRAMEKPKEQPNQQESSVLAEEDVKKMIEYRDISPEDLYIIEQLSKCPKNLFLEFHNFFTGNKGNLVSALENEIRYLKDGEDEKRKFIELYLELAKKYDWTVCWNVNIVFERRKK